MLHNREKSFPYITVTKDKNVGTTTTPVMNDLDNDRETINKETSQFGQMLAKLSPNVGIVDVEEEDDGMGNRFLLRTTSLKYMDAIKALFKDSVQYEVTTEICRVPQEGGPDDSLRPLQRTVTIYRKALKKLKRPLSLTLLYSSVCVATIIYCLVLFYRIVLA